MELRDPQKLIEFLSFLSEPIAGPKSHSDVLYRLLTTVHRNAWWMDWSFLKVRLSILIEESPERDSIYALYSMYQTTWDSLLSLLFGKKKERRKERKPWQYKKVEEVRRKARWKMLTFFLEWLSPFSLSRAISSDHSLFCHGYQIRSSIDEDFYSDRHSRLIWTVQLNRTEFSLLSNTAHLLKSMKMLAQTDIVVWPESRSLIGT